MRVILVGLGRWGRNWARKVLPKVAGVEAVAWVDASAETRATAAADLGLPAERCFATLEAAADRVDAEAVVAPRGLAADGRSRVGELEGALMFGKKRVCDSGAWSY